MNLGSHPLGFGILKRQLRYVPNHQNCLSSNPTAYSLQPKYYFMRAVASQKVNEFSKPSGS